MTDAQTSAPIVTAPKDETAVLTWGTLHADGTGETPKWRISWFGECGWYSSCSGTHEPSHWMPLPPPPRVSDEHPAGEDAAAADKGDHRG
jgi:hypothetical protein